jgi:hypothetical protein
MSGILDRFRVFHLTHFSKPPADRAIYRDMHQRRVRKILEIGIGTGLRASRMLWLARSLCPPAGVYYTGIDLFESRTGPDRPGLTLKEAHRLLRPHGAKVQLLPGNPLTTLSRVANSLAGFELVIVSADWDAKLMSRAWFYVPRMLARGARVYLEDNKDSAEDGCFRLLSSKEVAKLAEPPMRRRAA